MSIFVISLINSSRRNVISERAASAGVAINFIDAIEGVSLSEEVVRRVYCDTSCVSLHGRSLTRNEIACFLSHLKTWEIVSRGSGPAVILEDDAILASNFRAALSELDTAANCSDVIILGHSKLDRKDERYHYFKNPIFDKTRLSGFSVGAVHKLWTSGMVGYWLTPAAAKKLLLFNSVIVTVSDNWAHHAKCITVKEIRPYVVAEDFKSLVSSLEAERKAATTYRRRRYLEPARIAIGIYRNILSLLRP